MEIPLNQLYHAMDEAVRLVYGKQGKTVPAWVGAREAEKGKGGKSRRA